MASPATYFSILLLTLLSSLHVHARDSQFFNKMTSDNNNAKQLLPTKEHEEFSYKPEQDPNFIPQNSGGYGLFGHESDQLPSTTTTENIPETQNSYNKESSPDSNNDAYVNTESSYSNSNNGQYYNKDAYVTPITSNKNYYNGDNMYNNRQHGTGEAKLGVRNGNNYNNGGNSERHGMSDTRFMENGRYYYDLNTQNNYNLNNNANQNLRGFDSRNEYFNNRGNYGDSFRGNNDNSYEAKNSMEGYNGNQEEFQETPDEEFMP